MDNVVVIVILVLGVFLIGISFKTPRDSTLTKAHYEDGCAKYEERNYVTTQRVGGMHHITRDYYYTRRECVEWKSSPTMQNN